MEYDNPYHDPAPEGYQFISNYGVRFLNQLEVLTEWAVRLRAAKFAQCPVEDVIALPNHRDGVEWQTFKKIQPNTENEDGLETSHSHKCASCSTEWCHSNLWAAVAPPHEYAMGHLCPTCGKKELYQNQIGLKSCEKYKIFPSDDTIKDSWMIDVIKAILED